MATGSDGSPLTLENLVKRYLKIVDQGISISSENNCTSSSIFSENSRQFELGHRNRSAKPVNERIISQFDEEDNFYKRYYNLDTAEWKKNLWEIHPGKVPLSELIERMKPVAVDGLVEPRTEGIYGSVEGVDFNIGAHGHLEAEQVPENALVFVHFALFLEGENTPFDSSLMRRRGKPEILIASPLALLPSMAMAIRWLRVGQRGRFIFPPATFGKHGITGIVPPDTSVLLLLHVMKFMDVGALQRYELLTECEKTDFEKVHHYFKCANEVARHFFYRKNMSECVEVYKQCLEMLNGCKKDQDNHQIIEDLLLKTYVNLALSTLKIREQGNGLLVLKYLEIASHLKNFDTNCKAHYIKGKCYMRLTNYEEALKSLLAAYHLEPKNVEVGSELEKLDNILKQSKLMEKDMAKKYAKSERTLNSKEIKKRESMLSREDAHRVVQCIDELDKMHATLSYDTWKLMPDEVEILKALTSRRLDATTLYTLK